MLHKRFLLGVAVGLGTASLALAAPPAKRTSPRFQGSPQVIKSAPKGNTPPKVLFPKFNTLPKVEQQPKVNLPKFVPQPKVDLPMFNPRPKVDLPKFEPKVEGKPLILEPKGKLKGLPGLQLAGVKQINPAELAKLKPVLDAKKLKPGELGQLKPPADFKAKAIDLGKLKIPGNAPVLEKLNAGLALKSKDPFILNKAFCATGDYHLKFGKKCGSGWCFPGIHHCHWHHCMWDPYYSCHYYYCPSTCCYYYWCAADACYYPCWWFVDYGSCYYPWWLCGDLGLHIHGQHFDLHIGW